MNGRRIVWPEQGKAGVEEFEIPPLRSDHILLETIVSLISPGTERAFLLSLPNTTSTFPQNPGYNVVGKVVDIGKGVDEISIGDTVAASAPHSSHAVVSKDYSFIVPSGLSPERAVFYNLAATSLQAIRKARIELGESVLVMGQGIIGQLALQLAKLSGGYPTIAFDLVQRRLEIALQCGADFALNPRDIGYDQQLARITKGCGPRVVVESTGSPEPVNTAFKLAARQGRVILLASSRGETKNVNFYRDVHRKGLTIIGAHQSIRPRYDSSPALWTSREDCELALSLLSDGRLSVDNLITHKFQGEDAPNAYNLLASWNQDCLGMLLSWR